MKNKESTILITGGAGFIGSHVAEKLAMQNFHVIVVDNFDNFYKRPIKNHNVALLKNLGVKIIDDDVSNYKSMENIFKENSFDVIFHLAGKAGVRESAEKPLEYVRSNVYGTSVILECSRKFDVNKIVFASTSAVYGNEKPPFSEDTPTDNPTSVYASTKKECEVMCSVYNSLYGITVFGPRLFTVFGPRSRPDMAIQKFIMNIDAGIPITLYDHGRLKRDFVFISDVVQALRKCLESKKRGCNFFNIGSGRMIEISSIVQLIEMHTGKKAEIKYGKRDPSDPSETRASIEKARKLLGWSPKVGIEDGIKSTVEWWKREGKNVYD